MPLLSAIQSNKTVTVLYNARLHSFSLPSTNHHFIISKNSFRLQWGIYQYFYFMYEYLPARLQRNNVRLAASRQQIVNGWLSVECKNSTGMQKLHAKIACYWQSVELNLYLSGSQSHANYTRFAPTPGKLPLILFMFHATSGHAGTICIDWCPLEYNLNMTGGLLLAIFACAGGQNSAKPPVL